MKTRILNIFKIMLLAGIFITAGNFTFLRSEVEIIYDNLEQGFSKGKVEHFEESFNDKVFLALNDDTHGYFSKSQTINILKSYFEVYIPSSFYYTNQKSEGEYPFASAKYKYTHKGVKKSSRVFISLKYINHGYVITQITIN